MNIALILSGGTGTRLGSEIPKQYINVGGKLIITYCLETFAKHDMVNGIWIVSSDEWIDSILEDYQSAHLPKEKLLGFSRPGENRQLSILNALEDINSYYKCDDSVEPIIIIHDAARPNLSDNFITSCINAMDGFDGVMPVLPMKDTVYYSEDGVSVTSLIDRSKIYAGQAPEVYRLRKYLKANRSLLPDKILGICGSTEPAIIAGLNVALIPGDENNYKITTKADLDKFIKSH